MSSNVTLIPCSHPQLTMPWSKTLFHLYIFGLHTWTWECHCRKFCKITISPWHFLDKAWFTHWSHLQQSLTLLECKLIIPPLSMTSTKVTVPPNAHWTTAKSSNRCAWDFNPLVFLVPWGWTCFASPDISGRTSCTFLTRITCIAMTFFAVKDNLSKSCTYKRGNKLIRQNHHIFRSIHIPKPTEKKQIEQQISDETWRWWATPSVMHCPPLAPSSAFSHFLSWVCLPLSYAFNMPRNMCEIHNNIQHLDINNHNKSRKFVKHKSLTCQFLFAFEEAHLLLGPWAAKTTTSKIRVKSISFQKHAWPKSISRAKCISGPPPIVAFLHTVIPWSNFLKSVQELARFAFTK